jgi:branched-chain amino acid transport system ATP-binding protein
MSEPSGPPSSLRMASPSPFGGLCVVNAMSLELADGEILGVIGPNGAGKSTLFNLLAGAIPLDDGTMHLNGQDLSRAPPEARIAAGLGRTFQIPRPFSRMTVLENVMTAAQKQHGEA